VSMDEPRPTTLTSGDTAVLSCCTYSSRRRAVKFKLSGVKLASNAVVKVCLPAASRWHSPGERAFTEAERHLGAVGGDRS
jgi:hypothetical protein